MIYVKFITQILFFLLGIIGSVIGLVIIGMTSLAGLMAAVDYIYGAPNVLTAWKVGETILMGLGVWFLAYQSYRLVVTIDKKLPPYTNKEEQSLNDIVS